MTSPANRDLLHALLVPTVAAAGYDLEDLEVAQAGRRGRIRLSIDKDGGVTLDECAEVSRLVDEALEASEELGEAPYTLEVSSPGVSRPLTLPRHWRRNLGRLVEVSRRGAGPVTGRVQALEDGEVVLDVDGERLRVVLAEVAKARVQVEFSRATDRTGAGDAARTGDAARNGDADGEE